MKLKLWSVDFKPVWPTSNCLIILAYDKEQATEIAKNTITHTSEFTVMEMYPNSDLEPGVVIYMDGDY